jgi:hypothetical protein
MVDDPNANSQDSSQSADSSGNSSGNTSPDAGAQEEAQRKAMLDESSRVGRENKDLKAQLAALTSERDAAKTSADAALARANEVSEQIMEMRRQTAAGDPTAMRVLQQEEAVNRREQALRDQEATIRQREATLQAKEAQTQAQERAAMIGRVAAETGVNATALEAFGQQEEATLKILAHGLKSTTPGAATPAPNAQAVTVPANDPRPDPLGASGTTLVNPSTPQLEGMDMDTYKAQRKQQSPDDIQV